MFACFSLPERAEGYPELAGSGDSPSFGLLHADRLDCAKASQPALPALDRADKLQAQQLGCDTSSWFALRVRTRSEETVSDRLERKGVATFLPLYRAYLTTRKGLRRVECVAFPGYLFARFDARAKAAVLAVAGVHRVLSLQGAPVAVPDAEIEALRRALDDGAVPVPHPLSEGAKVRILGGPLKGIEGQVARANAKHFEVRISLLNRAVAVEIDPNTVEPI